MITRTWAFWRRVQYGSGFAVLFALILYGVYSQYLYVAPTCFDGEQNGTERGVDCGGACTRICAFDTTAPKVAWARSFKVTDGQYNAVAYLENPNQTAANPEVAYTFSLYDADGLIAERSGTTILPADSTYPVFEGRIITNERIPTQTFVDIYPGDVWVPAESGRDQFGIGDIDRGQLQDDRPRLNATVENKMLTEARDVEVVATIFDVRKNALTSSRTIVDTIAPRSQADVVFTWPEPIAKTLRSCSIPTDVLMAIDLSGSMNNDQDEPPEPITSVIAAAGSFVERLRSQDAVGVVTFATDATLELPLATNKTIAQDLIAKLTIDPQEERGSTNTGDALQAVTAEFRSERANPEARKVAVVLTDGLATAPDETPEEYALERALELRADGVEVYAIGLGAEVNMEFVQQLATRPDMAYQALTRDKVDAIYTTITGSICEDGAAVIDIVPKSTASFLNI